MAEIKPMRCVIICGSPETDPAFLKQQVHKDDYVICADNGYLYADKASVIPNLIIGDFDSYHAALPKGVEIIKLNVHKDDTDSMCCADVAIQRGFMEVVLFGATGGRLDHTFANLGILQHLYNKGVASRIEDENCFIEYRSIGTYNYRELADCTFSVFPFSCESVEVSYIGNVEYPAKNLTLKSSFAMGISNIFRDDNVSIKIENGNALIFVNKNKHI